MQKSVEVTGNYRWFVCGLVFFAMTINYLDRQVISLLKPILEARFGWSESDYANVTIAFTLAYATGFLIVGRLIDSVGTKIGYAVSLTVWSVASILHAAAVSTTGFVAARAFLGFSEAGNFPAAVKTIAEWFPKKERALATGIFNSGTNIGAIVAPAIVPWIAITWGWQMAFIITGAIGFIWLVLWVVFYEIPARQKRLSKAEYDYIYKDTDEVYRSPGTKLSWSNVLRFKQTWAFMIAKFLTDPVWWFLLFWLPSFLQAEYKMTGTQVSLPIAVVYVMATLGSVGGGWLSGLFILRGWPVYKARKISMLIFALCVIPIIGVQEMGKLGPWVAIFIIGLAAAAHQAWSATVFTSPSDMFPKKAIALVVGLGGMAGAAGAVLLQKCSGFLLDLYKDKGHVETAYYVLFMICGLVYILAWCIFFFLTPEMKPVNLADK